MDYGRGPQQPNSSLNPNRKAFSLTTYCILQTQTYCKKYIQYILFISETALLRQ